MWGVRLGEGRQKARPDPKEEKDFFREFEGGGKGKA
jgi:hypothetical protein